MTEEMLEAWIEDFQLGNWEEVDCEKFYAMSDANKLRVIHEYARNIPGFDGFMLDSIRHMYIGMECDLD